MKVIFSSALSLALFTGCSRLEYKVILQPDEPVAVRQAVHLDGREVGKVREIKQDGPNRFAVLRITDQAARNAMRIGIEREQRGADMRLSSVNVKPDAMPLENGAVIPTRAPLHNAAVTGLDSIERILWAIRDSIADHPLLAIGGFLLAAIILVALLRAVSGRNSRSSTWLLALAFFATTAAAADKGITYTRDALVGERTCAQRMVADAEQAYGAANRLTDAGLVREASEALVRAFFTADSADILLDGYLDRVARLKTSPLSYIKREEQKKLITAYDGLRQQIHDVQERAAILRHRCTATNEQDTALLQVFTAKRESFRSRARTGETDPTAVLEECRRLASAKKSEAEMTHLRQQVAAELAQLRRARERPNPPVTIIVTNSPPVTNTLVQFVTNRVFVDRPVTNIDRAIVTNPPPTVTPGQQNARSATNTNPSVARAPSMPLASTSQATTPPTEPNARPQSAPPFPGSTPRSRHGATPTAGAVNPAHSPPAPLPAPVGPTKKVVAPLTSTNTPTPLNGKISIAGATAPAQITNAPERSKSAKADPPAGSEVAGNMRSPARKHYSISPAMIASVGGGALVIGAVLWLMYLSYLRGRPFTLLLAGETGEPLEFELAAVDEAVSLQSPPTREAAGFVNGSPHITVSWRGALLRPGKDQPVMLNDAAVNGPRRLCPGDRIAIGSSSANLQRFQFLSCDPIPVQVAAEA